MLPEVPPASVPALLDLYDAQVRDLRALQTQYTADASLQSSHAYLRGWFASRIDAFERHRALLVHAASDTRYATSDDFDHALAWFQSLGQAFDVDLSWSPLGRPVFVRLGTLQAFARELRRALAGA